MTFALYRGTFSARLTVTTPEGQTLTAENLVGDSGFSMEFEARSTMDEAPGELTVTAYNLPADVLAGIEAAQVTRVGDRDSMLVDQVLRDLGVPADGSAALESGWLAVEMEAGYDGVMSRVARAIGARVQTKRIDDGLTDETRIVAVEDLDAVQLGLPSKSFPVGATLFELVDYLRRVAGLGPGNLTYASMTAILGEARLDSPYHCSGGQALTRLRSVLQYLPIRWFTDDREIWICGRDDMPNPNGIPAYITDEIGEPDLLLAPPERDDAGRVVAECLLCPRLRVGRLVNLTEAGLALALQGLSPSQQAIAMANVPPGLYRLDELNHRGATSGTEQTTRMLLRPGVAGP